MYINHRIYTDIESYRVFDINGNTAKAVRVKKIPNPEYMDFIPGGFVGHYPNQHDAYRYSDNIVDDGVPFEIVRHKNGMWGYWSLDSITFYGINEEGVERQKTFAKERGHKLDTKLEEDGTYTMRLVLLTKTGKPKRVFVKLGYLEENCYYFYDHNF